MLAIQHKQKSADKTTKMSRLFDLIPPVEGMNMNLDEVRDLSPYKDYGIIKELKQFGYGDDYPNAGDTITLRYIAYKGEAMEPEYIFDSSEKDGKDFVYQCCRGKVVRGFELAVLSMKAGERAVIYLKPEYAFGRSGAPPRVPAETPVIFDTTVINIECEDFSPNKDKSVLKKVLQKGTGYGQPNEGSLMNIHLKGYYGNNGEKVFIDEDIQFPYGEGSSGKYHVPTFIESLLDQWKIGERSRLFFKAHSAFGEKGYSDLGVPPNTDITYILEMINFEREKDIWEMNNEEKMDQCDIFKDKGNMYYKREEWELALKFYSKMLDFIEFDVCMEGEEETRRHGIMLVGFLNKAMVLLKVERYLEARECCNKVVEFDNTCIKAVYRRGLSYYHTNDWKEAKEDFERVVELEPKNKAARNHISVCNRKIKESAGAEKQLYQNMMSGVGKGPDNDRLMYSSGMNDIDEWDNRMAHGMMTLEEEREAFGESMPPRGGNNHGIEH